MTSTTTYSNPHERVGVLERVTHLLYLFTFFLALTTLWAMAETKSLESRTVHYLGPVSQAEIHAFVAAH